MESTNNKLKALTIAAVLTTALPLNANAFGYFSKNKVIGTVYTMDNSVDGNNVLVFDRLQSGKLKAAGSYATGGTGNGVPLFNQGAIVLDSADRFLFVVNAGSNDISVFEVEEDGLTLVDVEPSGGEQPISVTYSNDLLYVINNGGEITSEDNISGFSVSDDGDLSLIPGSQQALSGASVDPAQISFNADGDVLVVTEKASNVISTYVVDENGVAEPGQFYQSEGLTPFGFAFGDRDQVFVTEEVMGGELAGTMTSYQVGEDGALTPVSVTIPALQTGTCWAVVSGDGRFVYVTNTVSATISTYEIDFDGEITLLDDGVSASTRLAPLDMVISPDGRNLYTLDFAEPAISGYYITPKGRLIPMRSSVTIPFLSNGLAIR